MSGSPGVSRGEIDLLGTGSNLRLLPDTKGVLLRSLLALPRVGELGEKKGRVIEVCRHFLFF